MKKINLRQLVEDQINTFDLDYIEKLIIEIANKELKLIMSLGFLLGGIIGFFQGVIQSLSKGDIYVKVICEWLKHKLTQRSANNYGSKFIRLCKSIRTSFKRQ